jgi:hypothetical protein
MSRRSRSAVQGPWLLPCACELTSAGAARATRSRPTTAPRRSPDHRRHPIPQRTTSLLKREPRTPEHRCDPSIRSLDSGAFHRVMKHKRRVGGARKRRHVPLRHHVISEGSGRDLGRRQTIERPYDAGRVLVVPPFSTSATATPVSSATCVSNDPKSGSSWTKLTRRIVTRGAPRRPQPASPSCRRHRPSHAIGHDPTVRSAASPPTRPAAR